MMLLKAHADFEFDSILALITGIIVGRVIKLGTSICSALRPPFKKEQECRISYSKWHFDLSHAYIISRM